MFNNVYPILLNAIAIRKRQYSVNFVELDSSATLIRKLKFLNLANFYFSIKKAAREAWAA